LRLHFEQIYPIFWFRHSPHRNFVSSESPLLKELHP
jgi:hypothetical protein